MNDYKKPPRRTDGKFQNNTFSKNSNSPRPESRRPKKDYAPAAPAPAEQEEDTDIVAGRNAVMEVLKSGKSIDAIYVAVPDEGTGSLGKVLAKAKELKLVIKNVAPKQLDFMAKGTNHQGIVAVCSATEYCEVSDILALANQKGEPPFIILADEIEDPHNLGAIIRTAEACGAHGIIIPKRRSASVNSTVFKTSAGAAGVVKIAKVSNLVNPIQELKKANVWFYCAEVGGQRWDSVDYSGGVGLVIGSEGNGVSRLVRENCDFTVSMPMCGQINSLNASVAAGILMYEVVRNRLQK